MRADLHDTVCQQIVGIGFLAKRIGRDGQQQDENTSNEVSNIAREIGRVSLECSEAVRGIALGMKPLPDNDPAALHSALVDCSSYIGRVFGKHCRYKPSEPIRIKDPGVAGELFLIAREAALNAAKHSNGDFIEIGLRKKDGVVTLSVTNNGHYKKPLMNDAEHTMGLDAMRLRAGMIGADLMIEHKPGQDITVICKWKEEEDQSGGSGGSGSGNASD